MRSHTNQITREIGKLFKIHVSKTSMYSQYLQFIRIWQKKIRGSVQ